MRLASLILLFGLSLTAWAQGDEFGARYWYSEGRTTRSHNAQSADPRVGNPTSVLTWTDLTAHAVELHGRKNFSGGRIADVSLRCEYSKRDQSTISDTTPTVKGDNLSYVSVDVGTDLWRGSK